MAASLNLRPNGPTSRATICPEGPSVWPRARATHSITPQRKAKKNYGHSGSSVSRKQNKKAHLPTSRKEKSLNTSVLWPGPPLMTRPACPVDTHVTRALECGGAAGIGLCANQTPADTGAFSPSCDISFQHVILEIYGRPHSSGSSWKNRAGKKAPNHCYLGKKLLSDQWWPGPGEIVRW